MSIARYLAFLLVGICQTSAAGALASTFSISNSGVQSITAVAVRPSGTARWETAIKRTVPPGSDAIVNFKNGCDQDVRVTYARRVVVRERLNVCEVQALFAIDSQILTAPARGPKASRETVTGARSWAGRAGRYSYSRPARSPLDLGKTTQGDPGRMGSDPVPSSGRIVLGGGAKSSRPDAPVDAPGASVLPAAPTAPAALPLPGPAAPAALPLPALRPRITEFLFATNRSREFGVKDIEFGYGRQDHLTLGAARVSVPKHHIVGRLELPKTGYTLFGLSFGGEESDREKHFQIDSVTTIKRERWLELAQRTSSSESALVFVHGYNVDFREAVFRTSQIMYDLQYRGLVVLFTWPSRGAVLDYQYDRESALYSRRYFIELLRLLQIDGGIKQLNIIAHSMGNLIVADALANQADKIFKPQVNELIMAAPDIDRDQFLQGAKDILSLARGVTLYASSQDKAIALSRTLAGAPRAGDVFGGKPVLAAGIQAIDASVLGAEMLGLNHSTFAERRALMNDIRLLLTQKIRPPNLRMTEIRPMPEGSEDAPEYWRFTD